MSIPRISPQEAQALCAREGYVYLDVRSTGEFQQGHPEGSYNIPLAEPGPGGMAPNPHFLAAVQARFPKGTKLVLGCAAGGRSARAAAVLAQAGYNDLADQRAGFDGARDAFGRVNEAGWRAAGLPVASGPDAERGYEALRPKG